VIDLAIQRAKRRNPAMETSAFDFVRANLLPDPGETSEELYEARRRFAMKFQQYTGPLQAKGVEDTAFYRYHVLVSLNEVGGDPQRFGATAAQFHAVNRARQARSPHSMLCSATHDTKRGEDARARIHVISEAPREWRQRVASWAEINAPCRSVVDGADAPDRGDEYLFYQTLVGCWPVGTADSVATPTFVGRVREYMMKAIKEAKIHSSWISPNETYEQATAKFVEDVLTGPNSREFIRRFLPFQRFAARAGMVNSLAQVVLKAASPGVPDFYQGTELWDFSLVDPDNRRPVDYNRRTALLAEVEPWINDGPPPETVSGWLRQWPDGRIKLFVTASTLQLRKQAPELFLEGEYVPLTAEGELADNVVAFARQWRDQWAIAIVPRLTAMRCRKKRALPVGEFWGNTVVRLPDSFLQSTIRNRFVRGEPTVTPSPDGALLKVADVLAICPVAVLHSLTE
jgi:(1->4)-alpha-D-glucan 1-alpha-D-glucosylmutase